MASPFSAADGQHTATTISLDETGRDWEASPGRPTDIEDGGRATWNHFDTPTYVWDFGWRQTGNMLRTLRREATLHDDRGSDAQIPVLLSDLSKVSVESIADELGFLPPLDPSLSLWKAAATLEAELRAMQSKSSYSLRRSISNGLKGVLRNHIGWAVLFYALHVLCSLALPLIAFGLLQWVQDDDPSQLVGFGLVGAMLVSNSLAVLFKELYVDRCNFMGTFTMNALCGLAFRKVVGLSVADAFSSNLGQAVELMGGSADAVVGYWGAWVGLWLQPLEVISLVIVLCSFVGWAGLAGIGVVAIALGVTTVAGRRMEGALERRGREAEAHSQQVAEALTAVQAVKFNAWEPQFNARIAHAKEKELQHWRVAGRWLALVNAASNPSVDVISLSIVAAYTVLMGQALTPAILAGYWVVLALLHGKIFEFPESVRAVTDGAVAMARFEEFLGQAERGRGAGDAVEEGGLVLWADRAAFSWGSDAQRQARAAARAAEDWQAEWGHGELQAEALNAVSLAVAPGQLVGVTGAVASGKTTLLLGLLGELRAVEGRVLRGRAAAGVVAYAPQAAWIFSGTVRDNILLHRPLDPARYAAVLDACALNADMETLPHGDLTVIGERGTTLSGGQKQRVSLARAAYSGAPLVVIDDALAALDASVRAQVWRRCVCGLLRGSARLVVSHDPSALRDCHSVLTVEDGRVFEALGAGGTSGGGGAEEAAGEVVQWLVEGALRRVRADEDGGGREATEAAAAMGEKEREPDLELAEEEGAVGGEGLSGFVRHFARGAGGGWQGMGLVALMGVESMSVLLGVYVLSRWTERAVEDEEAAQREWRQFLGWYALLVAMEVGCALARNLGWVACTTAAVSELHGRLVRSLLHAPLAVLQRVRAGDVMHRLSTQLAQLDMQVMMASDLFLYGAVYGVMIAALCCSFLYWLVAAALAAFLTIQHLATVVDAGRLLQRLSARLRPELVEQTTATLQGLASVRAFRAEGVAMAQMQARADCLGRVSVACRRADSWLVLHSMLVAVAFFGFTALGIVLHAEGHGLLRAWWSVGPADAAMLVTWLCFGTFTAHTFVLRRLQLQALGRTRSALLSHLETAVEEGPYEEGPGEAAAGSEWPGDGRVELEDVVVRYAGGARPAVDGLSVRIGARERIAVVGRTGAGKSTLVAALTRMVALERGRVLVGGVDIAGLGLRRLRSAMSVVSQEPVIFSGSIRDNLDPFAEHSDEALWRVLEAGGMRALVQDKGGLGGLVAELGANLSAGQRQMLCVARALLRGRHLLVLDESTGSLDDGSEHRILAAVHSEAPGATVLHIAHRLHALLWCDRVLVMADGRARECAPPAELAAREGSELSRMLRGGRASGADSDGGELREALLDAAGAAASRGAGGSPARLMPHGQAGALRQRLMLSPQTPQAVASPSVVPAHCIRDHSLAQVSL